MPFKSPDNFQPFTASVEEAKGLRPLTKEEADELGIGEKKKEKRGEPTASPVIETKWTNPETKAEQEIQIDIQQEILFFQDFYKKHLLGITPKIEIDPEKVLDIWQANYVEIKEEIETYGYDSILIVPDVPDVPDKNKSALNCGVLNQKLIETMDEGVGKGKVVATWQSSNFTDGGSFAGVKNSSSPNFRLVLTHSTQNLDNHPLLKSTKGKDIMGLTGLDKAEVETRISHNQELPINFETEINGQTIAIQSEGLSLEEYAILQRMYFDKTGKHLDEIGWTWLLKSCSGSRVVGALWLPAARQLSVCANDPGIAVAFLGSRLSRSFKLA